jgi:hypothetical protein
MLDELRRAVRGAGMGGGVHAGEGGIGIQSLCNRVADHCVTAASSCESKASTCRVSHGAVCDNGASYAALCDTEAASCPALASAGQMPGC